MSTINEENDNVEGRTDTDRDSEKEDDDVMEEKGAEMRSRALKRKI